MIRFNTIVAAALLALAAGLVVPKTAMAPPPAPPPPQAIKDIQAILTPKTVFVTSQAFNGNLGGLAGADQKCQDAADDAGLPGVYKAWLSDDDETPAQRFDTLAVGPYIRTDGGTVAGGWGDLTDGTLNAAINRDENGTSVGTVSVWTATLADGSENLGACLNWTSASGDDEGEVGRSTGTDTQWTDSGEVECDNNLRLYCFEQ